MLKMIIFVLCSLMLSISFAGDFDDDFFKDSANPFADSMPQWAKDLDRKNRDFCRAKGYQDYTKSQSANGQETITCINPLKKVTKAKPTHKAVTTAPKTQTSSATESISVPGKLSKSDIQRIVEGIIDRSLPNWAQDAERKNLTFCLSRGYFNYTQAKAGRITCSMKLSAQQITKLQKKVTARHRPSKKLSLYEQKKREIQEGCMHHKGVIKKMPQKEKRVAFCKKFAKKQTDKILINACMSDPEMELEYDSEQARFQHCSQLVTGNTGSAHSSEECPRSSSSAVSITCKDGKHYVQKMDSSLGERPAELFNSSMHIVDSMQRKFQDSQNEFDQYKQTHGISK